MSLKYGILGLLAEEPLHGYEVKLRFEALLGGSWDVNIGQVYTTLQRLERSLLVEPVGRRGDRGKLAYRLTAEGKQALETWLTHPEREPQLLREEIYVKLLLASRHGPGYMDALLNSQRHVYLQRLKDLAELELAARRDGRNDLVLLYRGAIFHTEADLRWVDACADELRTMPAQDGRAW
jgi:DNA-binding PadR family transcriptional regulator